MFLICRGVQHCSYGGSDCGHTGVTTLVSGMEGKMLGSNNEYGIIVKNEEEALYQGIKLLVKDKKLRDDYAKRAKVRGSCLQQQIEWSVVEKMFFEIKG